MNETGIVETWIQEMGEEDYYRYAMIAAVSPKIPAFLSLLSSYTLLREISTELRRHSKSSESSNRRRNQRICKPLYQTLVAMSIADIFFSLPWFLTTWVAPSHLNYLWGNVGNYATCTFQGAIYQFGLQAGPLFSATYSLFSLLLVRYSWTESRLQSLVPWIHGSIWVYAAIVSIFPIFLGLYNNQGQICWFESYPLYCNSGEFEADCIRGENAWIYNLVFISFSPWFCLATAIVIMVLMYLSVRETEDRMAQYAGALQYVSNAYQNARNAISRSSRRHSDTTHAEDNTMNASRQATAVEPQHVTNREHSNAVAWQAVRYTIAFLTVYSLDLINRIFSEAIGVFIHELDFVAYILLPLQGLFNFMIFSRSKSLVTFEGRCLKRVLFGCFDPCKNSRFSRRTESTTARLTSIRVSNDITESQPAVDENILGNHAVAAAT